MRLTRGYSFTAVLGLVLLFSASPPVCASQFQVLQTFAEIPKNPVDRLIEAADGVFYGVSTNGGTFFKGSVFMLYRRPDATWRELTIHSFSGPDGARPMAGIIRGRDGNFYGTTTEGGGPNHGTVFKMSPTGALVTLYSFPNYYQCGCSRLVEATDGMLWGIANGDIFKIASDGTFTIVTRAPEAGDDSLIQASDGNFYGTGGTIAYKMTPAGTWTILHIFPYGDGRPKAGLIEATDGNFYGTTTGGSFPREAVFRMTPAGAVTIVYGQPFVAPGVGYDYGSLVEGPDHAFYGTTLTGDDTSPARYGTIFRVTPTGEFAQLAVFGNELGASPLGLTVGRDGRLYGITGFGPGFGPYTTPSGFGAAFSLATTGGTPALMYPFASDRPVWPIGRLLEADGALYGTSCYGGLHGFGTVYKVTAQGITTLKSFNELVAGPGLYGDGFCPMTGLVRGLDGAFYGTTSFGGRGWGEDFAQGTVFKVTASGDFTTLHRFTSGLESVGELPRGELTVGSDGALYGTTFLGISTSGTVFRVDPSGAFTRLHAFINVPGVPGPAYPVSGLVHGTDGEFYGVTPLSFDEDAPSRYSPGWLYRMSPAGAVTDLHSFDPELGFPISLMESTDGHLYGIAAETSAGAAFIFKSTLSGTVTKVHDFVASADSHPTGVLIDSGDGGLYGTTHGKRNTSDFGSVFKLHSEGTFTTVHRFGWLDGAYPFAGVTRASDGALYGTAPSGGPGGNGVIYRIVP